MRDANRPVSSRRELLQNTGRLAAASALASVAIPSVHAAGTDLIQVALVGCGGRGTGAAANALSTKSGPIKLVAMADVFEDKLWKSYKNLHGDKELSGKLDVPDERQFIGFDAYKKAMDCLKPGDVAIFATPPAFRWVHFTYAIEKGLNVFMEKPVTVDGPTSKRMLALGEAAAKKNLKVGVGLMSRHSRALQELAKRIHDGAIGEIILPCAATACTGRSATSTRCPSPQGIKRTAVPDPAVPQLPLGQRRQLQRFLHPRHRPLLLDEERLAGEGPGAGRPPLPQEPEGIRTSTRTSTPTRWNTRSPTAPSSSSTAAAWTGCEGLYASYLHGTKGTAIVSKAGDIGQPSSIYKTQSLKRPDLVWESKIKPEERIPTRTNGTT